jgi:hypothetical protein
LAITEKINVGDKYIRRTAEKVLAAASILIKKIGDNLFFMPLSYLLLIHRKIPCVVLSSMHISKGIPFN